MTQPTLTAVPMPLDALHNADLRAHLELWHADAAGLELEGCAAVRARRMRVEQGVNLLLEEVSLERAEQLCGLGQGQPEMFNALIVLLEGNDIGDGLFMTVTVTDDELQFDAQRRAAPGSSGR